MKGRQIMKEATIKDRLAAIQASQKTMDEKWVREYFGHNGHECKVRIQTNGRIYRHGSPDPVDRSKDFWSDLGTMAERWPEVKEWYRTGSFGCEG